MERAIFEIVKPAAIEASIKAAEQLKVLANEKRDAVELSLRQARYEAQRAFAQYNAVDPANRLVSSELERRWNSALQKEKVLEHAFT